MTNEEKKVAGIAIQRFFGVLELLFSCFIIGWQCLMPTPVSFWGGFFAGIGLFDGFFSMLTGHALLKVAMNGVGLIKEVK